jgi:hypothetical protein
MTREDHQTPDTRIGDSWLASRKHHDIAQNLIGLRLRFATAQTFTELTPKIPLEKEADLVPT